MKWGSGSNLICPICDKEFYLPPCRIKSGIKHCSKKCGYIGRGQSNTGRTHFKKGQIPWNKDKKDIHLSPDSEFKKGMTPWNKGLGMGTEAQRLRWSDAYKEWRTKIFERDNWTCQECGMKGDIQVHHIKSYALYSESRLDIENGITLCVECHKKTDNYGRLTKKQKEESMEVPCSS